MRILTLIFLVFIVVFANAQVVENKDSLFLINSDSLIQEGADTSIILEKDTLIVEDLDSLLLLENNKFKDKNKKIKPIVFADSVYIEQLDKLVSAFDLTYNEKVKAFINLYANKRRQQVGNMLGLSEYYFPMFEEYLDRQEIPLELRYLPVIESALNTRARSRVGATGLWQFMYSTGKMYGLEINSYVDERRDPVKATIAASKFLKDMYKTYGDWTLVIAAYNCGPGNVNKAIRRSGGKRDFWEIYYRLPRETRGYVPAFIAANYIMAYYKDYGIKPVKVDRPAKTDTIIINEFLHLQQVADVLQIPIETLRDLNPQYRLDIIPAKVRTYPLRLPVKYVDKFIDLKDSIFAYKDSVFFNPEKKIIAPPKHQKGRRGSVTYAPPPTKDMVKIMYTIKPGDNVGYIASWYSVRLSDLRYWNNIYRDRIKAGQKLVIYKYKNVASKFLNINKMSFEAKQKMLGKTVKKDKLSNKTTKTTSSKTSGKYVYYTVKRGDNFWTIAKKYPGVSNIDIMKLNGITDENSLKVGQKLKIKRK